MCANLLISENTLFQNNPNDDGDDDDDNVDAGAEEDIFVIRQLYINVSNASWS